MAMKTYNFKVVVEPDEDFDGNPSGWHAYCPALHEQGAATWGGTREEALRNIEEVVRLVMESMVEHNERLPEALVGEVEVTVEPRVAVTVRAGLPVPRRLPICPTGDHGDRVRADPRHDGA